MLRFEGVVGHGVGAMNVGRQGLIAGGVVGEGLNVGGGRAGLPGLAGEVAHGVVGITGGVAGPIQVRGKLVVGVVGIGQMPQRIGLHAEQIDGVIGVSRVIIEWIADAGHVAGSIVALGRQPAVGRGGRRQLIVGVVGIAGAVAQWIDGGEHVAPGIVDRAGKIPQRVLHAGLAIDRIVIETCYRPQWIGHLYHVTHGVQRIGCRVIQRSRWWMSADYRRRSQSWCGNRADRRWPKHCWQHRRRPWIHRQGHR